MPADNSSSPDNTRNVNFAESFGAVKKNTGFKSISQSEAVLQSTDQSGTMFETSQSESSLNGQTGLKVPVLVREPSINSQRSDSRRSHGSISSTDFELR